MVKIPVNWDKVGTEGKVKINYEDNATFTSQSPALEVNGDVVSTNISALTNTSNTHTSQITGLGSRLDVVESALPSGTFKATSPFTVSSGKVVGLESGTGRFYSNGFAYSNPSTADNAVWLKISGTTASDTEAEIGIGNSPAPLYLRQYDASGAIVKEIKLIGREGSTQFPGEVTASKFIGNLQGNADSATTASSATSASSAATASSADLATAAIYLKDSNNNSKTYGRYSDSGLNPADISYLACWNETSTPSSGYELRKLDISKIFKVEELYNGTLNSGSTTFAAGYKFYIVEGDITNNASRYIGAVVPDSSLTPTDQKYCFTDESKYVTFWLSKENSIVTLTFGERTGTGGIRRVWGIN